MTILVDSSVWIDFFNGTPSPEAQYFRQELRKTPLIVGDLILTEVLQGFRQTDEFEIAREAMWKFKIVSLVGRAIALQSAQNYRLLRAKGITIRSTIDCIIATYCIANEYALLHSDRDYSHFEELLGLRTVRVR